MDFLIELDTVIPVMSVWSIVYNERSHVIFSKNDNIFFFEDCFCLDKQCRPYFILVFAVCLGF